MVKRLYLVGLFLFSFVVLVFAHYLFSDAQQVTDATNRIVAMTHMASLSLGAAYYEPRVERIKSGDNPIYPEMMPLGRMDFVYAR